MDTLKSHLGHLKAKFSKQQSTEEESEEQKEEEEEDLNSQYRGWKRQIAELKGLLENSKEKKVRIIYSKPRWRNLFCRQDN